MNLGATIFAQFMYFLPLSEFCRCFEPASCLPPNSGDLVLEPLPSPNSQTPPIAEFVQSSVRKAIPLKQWN
jgi:hypothetical protein